MDFATNPAANLWNTIPADTNDMLITFRRQLFLIVLSFPQLFFGLVKFDLAAAGAAVDLHLQSAGQDISPITGEKSGLSQLKLFPLQKLRLSAAVSATYRSHSAFITVSMTPLTPVVSTVSMRPLS